MEISLKVWLAINLVGIIIYTAYALFHKQYKYTKMLLGLWLILLLASILAAVLPRNSFYGPVVSRLGSSDKIVALTFDDGPYPPYTEQLLAVLNKEQVPATFFMVGKNALQQPKLVQQVLAGGHDLGVHTYDHIDLLKLDRQQATYQVQQGKKVLETLAWREVKLIRPPHGFKDPLVLSIFAANKLQIVNWDVASKDWLNPAPEIIAARTLKQVQNGSIILLHDGDSPYNKLPRANTILAVQIIIRELKAQGYKFVLVKDYI